MSATLVNVEYLVPTQHGELFRGAFADFKNSSASDGAVKITPATPGFCLVLLTNVTFNDLLLIGFLFYRRVLDGSAPIILQTGAAN